MPQTSFPAGHEKNDVFNFNAYTSTYVLPTWLGKKNSKKAMYVCVRLFVSPTTSLVLSTLQFGCFLLFVCTNVMHVNFNCMCFFAHAGTKFDSSFDRGEPLEMIVGKTGVPGWDDGTYGACVGETRKASLLPKSKSFLAFAGFFNRPLCPSYLVA